MLKAFLICIIALPIVLFIEYKLLSYESKKEIKPNNDEIKIIGFNNKNIINITQHDYLGYFYSWDDVRKYLNNHHPESYINKVFSISINNEYHYYLIISSCVIEEVTLPSNAGELKS